MAGKRLRSLPRRGFVIASNDMQKSWPREGQAIVEWGKPLTLHSSQCPGGKKCFQAERNDGDVR